MRYLLIILSLTFLNANWETLYYVDEFGDPTNKKYLSYTTYGSFDNTATTNSPLRVEFLVESDEVNIKLYEYNGNTPKKYPSDKYEVRIKYNGIKDYFYPIQLSGDRLRFGAPFISEYGVGYDGLKLLNIFYDYNDVNFYIIKGRSDYSFKLDEEVLGGFKELHQNEFPNINIYDEKQRLVVEEKELKAKSEQEIKDLSTIKTTSIVPLSTQLISIGIIALLVILLN